MNKQEIQAEMRTLLTRYNELKDQLDGLLLAGKLEDFEKRQRALLDKFKATYTVERAGETIRPIDWADVERNLLNAENIKGLGHEGYVLGYDENGEAGLGMNYRGGGTGCNYHYDELDAQRSIEREAKRREHAARNKR